MSSSSSIELQRDTSGIKMDSATPNKLQKTPTLIQIVKSKLFISIVIVVAVMLTLLCIGLVVTYENKNDVTDSIDAWKDKLSEEQLEWFDVALDELKMALKVRQNTRRAKNVILFVGDGMGPNTLTASRIYKYGEEGNLVWDTFPHMGALKTYSVNKQVPDSAVTATALFGGVKGNSKTSGVDSHVDLDDCKASLNERHHVKSILELAQNEEMATGFVTTTRVTHATPAALYAHCPNRNWECEAKISEKDKVFGCIDIARQLIEHSPGKDINVIMGGGRQCLQSNVTGTDADPIDEWACISSDGRDLISDWKKDKNARELTNAVVQNKKQLDEVDLDETDYLLGIFANGHMPYEDQRDESPNGPPSLKEMTIKALSVLVKNPKGFILVVEGGLIDVAHHRGWAKRALEETIELNDAVEATIDLMRPQLDETLIIVTADHAHSLSINGYANRGDSILGIAERSKVDDIPFTTLTYATGGSESFQYEVEENGKVKRKDPSSENTQSYTYRQQTGILSDETNHGGVDVAIHAVGPMAHLFHRVHEQNYVTHVISYAARIGRFRDNKVVQTLSDLLGLS